MPALPLDEAGKYVAGAYVVFFALILIYVVIMAARLQRLERELTEIDELASRKDPDGDGTDSPGPTPEPAADATAPASSEPAPEEARLP